MPGRAGGRVLTNPPQPPDADAAEDAWNDGYLVAVADQLDWWFQSDWDTLHAVDPAVRTGILRELLGRLEQLGVPVSLEPRPITVDAARIEVVIPLLADLRARVGRVRAAGARAFAEPWLPVFHLACTTFWPLRRSGVPDLPADQRDRVVLLEADDFPKDHPQWLARGQIATFTALEALSLQGNGFDGEPLGIDLAALTRLRILDLERNDLSSLPAEVLACRSLEALLLYDNQRLGPGLDVGQLAKLTSLRKLDLRGTGIPPDAAGELRAALPGCTILL